MEIGTKYVGERQQIPSYLLLESVPSAIYEIDLTPQTAISPSQFNAVTNTIITEIPRRVRGCTVKYVSVEPKMVKMQLTGAFSLAALLLALPQILILVGVAILFIVVYLMVSSIPNWLYALGAVFALAIYITKKR